MIQLIIKKLLSTILMMMKVIMNMMIIWIITHQYHVPIELLLIMISGSLHHLMWAMDWILIRNTIIYRNQIKLLLPIWIIQKVLNRICRALEAIVINGWMFFQRLIVRMKLITITGHLVKMHEKCHQLLLTTKLEKDQFLNIRNNQRKKRNNKISSIHNQETFHRHNKI